MKEKIWGILVHLSMDQWEHYLKKPLSTVFDEATWHEVVEETAKCGMNTIVLDVGNGIRFKSHPEIAKKDAFSVKWMRAQVKKCREKGIALIPKLNFATTHDMWLGEYSRMISTSIYYKVVKDLIEEVYEIFDHPAFVHLGMDEESFQYIGKRGYVVYRQGELYFHDLKYLCDCVNSLGAKPWIWSSAMYDHPEQFMKCLSPDEVIINPYYYNAFDPKHYTPIESRAEYRSILKGALTAT